MGMVARTEIWRGGDLGTRGGSEIVGQWGKERGGRVRRRGKKRKRRERKLTKRVRDRDRGDEVGGDNVTSILSYLLTFFLTLLSRDSHLWRQYHVINSQVCR